MACSGDKAQAHLDAALFQVKTALLHVLLLALQLPGLVALLLQPGHFPLPLRLQQWRPISMAVLLTGVAPTAVVKRTSGTGMAGLGICNIL